MSAAAVEGVSIVTVEDERSREYRHQDVEEEVQYFNNLSIVTDRPSSSMSGYIDRPSSRLSNGHRSLQRRESYGSPDGGSNQHSPDGSLSGEEKGNFKRKSYGSVRISTNGVTRIKIGKNGNQVQDQSDGESTRSGYTSGPGKRTRTLLNGASTPVNCSDTEEFSTPAEAVRHLLKRPSSFRSGGYKQYASYENLAPRRIFSPFPADHLPSVPSSPPTSDTPPLTRSATPPSSPTASAAADLAVSTFKSMVNLMVPTYTSINVGEGQEDEPTERTSLLDPKEPRVAVLEMPNGIGDAGSGSDEEDEDQQLPGNSAFDQEDICIENKRNSISSLNESMEIPDEPLKTLASFIFLIFGFLVTTVSLSVTHERMPDYPPLPDIVLDNTNYLEWGLDASEYILISLVFLAFLLVIFHKHRMIVLRRIFLMVGMLYMYRGITMFVTVLPKPDSSYYCSPKLNHSITFIEVVQRSLRIISGGGLSINGNQVYCGDFIFSGHTMTLFLAFFVIREYSPRKYFALHGIVLGMVFTALGFLLVGRGHYTIDVLIAYWVTSRLWWVYHTVAHTHHLRLQGEHNFVSNMWWWYPLRYFEKEVGGPLPRLYTVPLPRSFKRLITRSRRARSYQQLEGEV